MGIIKALTGALGGGLADQWQEVIEADDMGERTVFTKGVTVRPGDRRNGNRRGTSDIVSNGSVIHVYPNQFMMLVDGGKIVDYTAEPGYYTVSNSAMPSMLNGELGASLRETFGRFRFGGVTPQKQQVFFLNLQEIKGIRFGTRNAINYFDGFYNAELFLRAHGTYSIAIVDPIKFFMEVVPRNAERLEIDTVNEQYLNEFLEGLASAINQMSADGQRISFVTSHSRELSRYMNDALDAEVNTLRGMEVRAVGMNISYDEESQKLINMRNQGAMLGDPAVREGYVQGAMARGMEAAGSNSAGAAAAFMGMGVGMQAGGGFMAAASQSNQAQMAANRSVPQPQPAAPSVDGWTRPACGKANTGKFCAECGAPKPAAGWSCPSCGTQNTGKFCTECGTRRPGEVKCDKCGWKPEPGAPLPKFCPECGDPFDGNDRG